ncbi:hypothetical protein DY000_02055763 [Brassica cretica]|uniref:Uncharacterized protein n=1 Tax=Brassica cretica TaxID=69181 RepID=A0ABQ7A5I1_BRACR|nr:hypothetical protein DY000_02055763 [Brassica cretica]
MSFLRPASPAIRPFLFTAYKMFELQRSGISPRTSLWLDVGSVKSLWLHHGNARVGSFCINSMLAYSESIGKLISLHRYPATILSEIVLSTIKN